MKIKSIILAGIFGTALASQGEVVYQSASAVVSGAKRHKQISSLQ